MLLISILVFPKSKPITLEIIRGWGRGFLCSSLPNHDSKSIEEEENRKQNTNQGQAKLERVRAQKLSTNNNCNECIYDACSNA